MKKKFKEIGINFFPNYDFYEKAISYPYLAPSKPFSFVNGKCLEGIHISLKDRKPILSVGSNRSPYQLKNKFSLTENLCVTPATLLNSEIVYSSSISAYGSIPATQWPLKGARVELNVLWLNNRQLQIMHLTEGIGIAYDFVELTEGSVLIKDIQYNGPVYGYVSVNGVYGYDDKHPIRLSSLKSFNSKLYKKNEFETLNYIKNYFEIEYLSLKHWINKLIVEQNYRIELINKMTKKSLKPINPPWKKIKVNVKGVKIF